MISLFEIINKKFTYAHNCIDADECDVLFNDATEMAQSLESDGGYIKIPYKKFINMVDIPEDHYQIIKTSKNNIEFGVNLKWRPNFVVMYDEINDIHYFYY